MRVLTYELIKLLNFTIKTIKLLKIQLKISLISKQCESCFHVTAMISATMIKNNFLFSFRF